MIKHLLFEADCTPARNINSNTELLYILLKGHFINDKLPYDKVNFKIRIIIESVDSICRDETDSQYTQYITNEGISRARYIHYHAF